MTLARKTLGIRKNLKEEKRREEIRDAAIDLFSTKGYDQTTMDDIVVSAGFSKSLIYWYWKSKSALVAELVDTCMGMYRDLLKKAVQDESPYMEKIQRFMDEYFTMFRANEKLNRLVHFCSIHTSKKGGEEFSVQVDAYYAEILELMAELARQGIGAGILRKELDARSTALFLLSFVEGYIYMTMLSERPPLEKVLRPLFEEFVGRSMVDRETIPKP